MGLITQHTSKVTYMVISWYISYVRSRSVVDNSLWPHGLYNPPGSSVTGIFQAKTLEWVPLPSSEDHPDPGIDPCPPVSSVFYIGRWILYHCETSEDHSNIYTHIYMYVCVCTCMYVCMCNIYVHIYYMYYYINSLQFSNTYICTQIVFSSVTQSCLTLCNSTDCSNELQQWTAMTTQDWFPLGWTGWISLQSKGLSRVFSNTAVQKHQFFSAQLFFIVQLSHPYMTAGKTITLTSYTYTYIYIYMYVYVTKKLYIYICVRIYIKSSFFQKYI